MENTLNIPEGYVLVPKDWAETFFTKAGWQDIENPTISEVTKYLGVCKEKIKQDLNKMNCPLKKSHEGGKGRGREMRFFKQSVEHYKQWLNNNKLK